MTPPPAGRPAPFRPTFATNPADALTDLSRRIGVMRGQCPAQMGALADHIESYAADAGRQGWASQQGMLGRIAQGLHGRAKAVPWHPLSEEEIRQLAEAVRRVGGACATRAQAAHAPTGGDAA